MSAKNWFILIWSISVKKAGTLPLDRSDKTGKQRRSIGLSSESLSSQIVINEHVNERIVQTIEPQKRVSAPSHNFRYPLHATKGTKDYCAKTKEEKY